MTVCVECGELVAATIERHDVGGVHTADSVRLARCQHCGKVCDKYQEYDVLLVLLDAMLLRRPALRHLLCNVPSSLESGNGLLSSETVLALLSLVFWIVGVHPVYSGQWSIVIATVLLAFSVLPYVCLKFVCKVSWEQLRRIALVALNVVFPFCCFCLVWGPEPYYILHGFSYFLHLCVLFNAFFIFGHFKHGKTDSVDSGTVSSVQESSLS